MSEEFAAPCQSYGRDITTDARVEGENMKENRKFCVDGSDIFVSRHHDQRSTWGSPTATKHALLTHGLTSCSHTWHRVASSLAAQGYLVTAPDLVGHVSRVSTNYRLSSIAQDLCPYLEEWNYSLIIGHSLGALAALALFAHFPPSHPTAIMLVDPPLQVATESIPFFDNLFSDSCANPKQAETYSVENPQWEREDGIFRELGTRLCSVDAVHGIFETLQFI
ncbi:alpha/beta-hydrolase [Imleria badia]|nr:alpha/beta-hydrolase [Imleria badia]